MTDENNKRKEQLEDDKMFWDEHEPDPKKGIFTRVKKIYKTESVSTIAMSKDLGDAIQATKKAIDKEWGTTDKLDKICKEINKRFPGKIKKGE